MLSAYDIDLLNEAKNNLFELSEIVGIEFIDNYCKATIELIDRVLDSN
jgi:hypothetical protein